MTSVSGPADAAQVQHLANQVHDHSTVLQALQVDMRHAVKLLDKLVLVADKQTELGHEMSRHSDAIEGVKSELARAIDGLTTVFKADREKAEKVAETVTGYKGGLKTLMWVGGAVTGLLLIIGTMFVNVVQREQTRTNDDVAEFRADFERRKLSVDIELRSLGQSVQEVRLSRARDLEKQQGE